MPREYPAAIDGSISSGHVLGDDFSASMEAFKIKSMAKAEKVIRLAIMNMYGEIIETSPVKTGLFRVNSQIGVNAIPSGTLYAEHAPKGASYPKPDKEYAKSKLQSWKLQNVAYICNNLSYAVVLEFGHSNQAPTGIYRKAALKMDTFLSTAAASVKG